MNNYLIIILVICAAFVWAYIWKTNVFEFETKKPKKKKPRKRKAKKK
tara:strand:+ start:95 stop:235 length:141 start_codon:yes stop_codon:yes gene_type:complete